MTRAEAAWLLFYGVLAFGLVVLGVALFILLFS